MRKKIILFLAWAVLMFFSVIIFSASRSNADCQFLSGTGPSFTGTTQGFTYHIFSMAAEDVVEAQTMCLAAYPGKDQHGGLLNLFGIIDYIGWPNEWHCYRTWMNANSDEQWFVLYPSPGNESNTNCDYGCDPGLPDLQVACGGSANVEWWDEELCEGWCAGCEEIMQDCVDNCLPHEVASYSCTEYYGDVAGVQRPISLTISPCICGDQTCDDYAVQCNDSCGGVENVASFACVNDQVIIPCTCIDNDYSYDDTDWEPPTDDIVDPEALDPPGTQTDNEALQNISENTFEISGSSHRTAENTASVATNTEQIGKVLDEKLSKTNKQLQDIELALDDLKPSLDSSDVSDLADVIDDHSTDVLTGLQSSLTSDTQTAIDETEIADSVVSNFFNQLENIFPSYSSECTPIDWNINVMGVNRQIYFGCDISDMIKGLLAFIIYIATVLKIISIIRTDMVPSPGSGNQK